MLEGYLPILLMVLVAGAFAAVGLLISWIMGPSKPDASKDSPYECGVPPVGDARERYSIRFYVIAMLFIVFDLETVFLFPWAVIFRQEALFFFLEMVVFLGILLVGYIYVWRMGALDWNAPRARLLWETTREPKS
jgi:NADH-quinone oxidoreductase subunit A